jgi:hypothetical protein
MKKNGKSVTYLVYPDEVHDYVRNENWNSLFAVAERFWKQYLGGRIEPIDREFKNTSMKISEEAELIVDLPK